LDTPLGEAAYYGHLDIIQYLLDNKANKSLKNNEGLTAYDRAYVAGQKKATELIGKQ
jgi:ankyrin repeat protein